MAVDLLDAPLRISWDLCPAGQSPLSNNQLLQVARQLGEAGIFFVTLEDSPLRHPQIGELLQELTSGGCQVALVTDGSGAERAVLAQLESQFALFVDAASCIENRRLNADLLGEVFSEIRQHHAEPALLWMPKPGQLALLPELLVFCARWQVSHFKLPNQKIGANCENSSMQTLPDCDDLDRLAALLASAGLPEVAGLQLEVHDLFIWELLQPLTGGQRSEYGGCQAANSLGHISGQAELWPCSSWPEPLGSLLNEDLLDLWQSPQRLKVREEIARLPLGCDGCRDFQVCFGGCRGLSRFCRDDGLERDLLCRERR